MKFFFKSYRILVKIFKTSYSYLRSRRVVLIKSYIDLCDFCIYIELKFHMKLPIFCARQLIRHRTANVNEYSGRYSEMTDEFYMPDNSVIQPQSKNNK